MLVTNGLGKGSLVVTRGLGGFFNGLVTKIKLIKDLKNGFFKIANVKFLFKKSSVESIVHEREFIDTNSLARIEMNSITGNPYLATPKIKFLFTKGEVTCQIIS